MKNVNVNTRKNGPEPVQEVTEDMWRNFRIKVFIKRSVGFFRNTNFLLDYLLYGSAQNMFVWHFIQTFRHTLKASVLLSNHFS